jgi:hypothetical protein
MKRVFLILTVLLIAAPALATVTVSGEQDGELRGKVEYSVTPVDANLPRAFAFNITVSDGNIVDVCDVNPAFYIHPGSFSYNEGTGEISGEIVCDGDIYPDTQQGLGTGGATTEQGSLYIGESNAPATSGVLFRIVVDTGATVTIQPNLSRGGVVMEDPDEDPGTTFPVVFDIEGIGCQCWGDISSTTIGVPDTQVSTSDFSHLINYLLPYQSVGYVAPITSGYECIDISSTTVGQQDNQISTSDFSALINYLLPYQSVGYIAPCMPTPVPPGP